MAASLLVLQSGGPTAVINTSLYGVIDEARRHARFDRILGGRAGMAGLMRGDCADLTSLPEAEMERLRFTPAAYLGSSRMKPSDADFHRIAEWLKTQDVRALLIIGGNGSQRAVDVIDRTARAIGHELSVIGIPKTVDNDISLTDRCPGFGSAARYVAQSVMDLGMDVRALPQPVSIFETMGRSAGWLAGASVLAKLDETHAPHLIYLPEKAFHVDQFLADVARTVKEIGWCVAVVSEGLKDPAGNPVYEISHASQRDDLNRALPGGVAAHLAKTVTERLRIRCRWEQPGLCARSSTLHISKQDWNDAEAVGRAGVRAAIEGKTAVMISLKSLDREGGVPICQTVPVTDVAGGARTVPLEWLSDSPLTVNENFVNYVRPIVGRLLGYALLT